MAVIAPFILVAAILTPAAALTPGAFIYLFVLVVVIGIYSWHKEEGMPRSVREWAQFLGGILLSTAVLIGVGVGFAYFKGVRGDVIDMIGSNGLFIVVMYLCPATALVATGGLVRALVLHKLTGREPD